MWLLIHAGIIHIVAAEVTENRICDKNKASNYLCSVIKPREIFGDDIRLLKIVESNKCVQNICDA